MLIPKSFSDAIENKTNWLSCLKSDKPTITFLSNVYINKVNDDIIIDVVRLDECTNTYYKYMPTRVKTVKEDYNSVTKILRYEVIITADNTPDLTMILTPIDYMKLTPTDKVEMA